MCGITLSLSAKSTPKEADLHSSLAASNASRGPNSSQTYHETISTADGSGEIELALTACVLGLRGALTPQPLIGRRGVLAWNGQVFDGLTIRPNENDTRIIFDQMEAGRELIDVLSEIEGPYACVYYDRLKRTLSFQVDPLSRRSLLIALPSPNSPSFYLSSTRSSQAREQNVQFRALLGGEGGIIHLDRIQVNEGGMLDVDDALEMRPCLPGPSTWNTITPINTDLPPDDCTPSEMYAQMEVENFEAALLAAVHSRVDNIPAPTVGEARVAVLFSGGVDCSLLAYMVHQCIPSNEPIELINVAFQREPSAGLAAANISQKTKGWTKTKKKRKQHPVRSVPVDTHQDARNGEEDPAEIRHDVEVKTKDVALVEAGNGASLIEAGDNPPPITIVPEGSDSDYDTPDRQSGHAALAELRSACPGREWRFVAVNVTYEEYHEHRQRIIDLMYPSTTEMDLSLAYPLYFASRGLGTLDGAPYHVQAKVYISGLGADEQLGGYARHRHAYSTSSFPGLLSSLQSELSRLPQRNTSRDDRLLSSFARDARYPYLSLRFINYLSAVPIWAKVHHESPEGWGDKLLLRLAADRAGLHQTARRVKRAMQFGSRSAKVDGGVKGKAAGSRSVG